MILVNRREQIAWEEGLTVARLLERLRFTFPHIIVSITAYIIYLRKSPYGRTSSSKFPHLGSICSIDPKYFSFSFV